MYNMRTMLYNLSSHSGIAALIGSFSNAEQWEQVPTG